MHENKSEVAQSSSVMSNFLRHHGLQPTRLFRPWDFPGKSTGVGYHCLDLQFPWASLVVQLVKNLAAMWDTWVRSLGWEDPLEKGMVTHSSILAWKIPWKEEPGGL